MKFRIIPFLASCLVCVFISDAFAAGTYPCDPWFMPKPPNMTYYTSHTNNTDRFYYCSVSDNPCFVEDSYYPPMERRYIFFNGCKISGTYSDLEIKTPIIDGDKMLNGRLVCGGYSDWMSLREDTLRKNFCNKTCPLGGLSDPSKGTIKSCYITVGSDDSGEYAYEDMGSGDGDRCYHSGN